MADILSDIFETIRLRATLYFRTDYSPPWAITVPKYEQAARFHLVVQGRCHIELASGTTTEIGPGDLILIPRGQQHVLSDQKGRIPAPLETIIEKSGYDGNGTFVLGERNPSAATQMVCGHFGFTKGADHPLLRSLPEFITMTPADRAENPILDETLRLVVRRVFAHSLGASAAISRLSEVFFIEAVRASINKNPELSRILEAMTDKNISHSLELIHQQTNHAWTVETLASEVGMSRSRFAERFSNLLGDGPMGYLTNWRLQQALPLLSQPNANIQDIANQVGYQSASAFTRAFAQKFGTPPSEFRQKEI
ncbi:MAG: AraC family transcriptional regulator [Methyloligella sp.]|nr:MAG: AraC family transcriptional regulator [Methyloligella sp.]